MVARAAISSAIAAARVVSVVDQPSDSVALWGILAGLLQASSKRISGGDLTEVEEMLVHQAAALQSIFVKLTEGALKTETLANFDLKFRYALRAQSQCRATLETLAAIKNPPTVFARQANVTTGPQQINNRSAPRAHAGGSAFEQNEQSGGGHDLRQDTRTPQLACGADTALAAVGAIDGATDGGRQGAVFPQRLEGRMAPAAPGVEQGAGRAKARG